MATNRKGQIASRQHVVDDFNSDVYSKVRSRYVWTSSNHPSNLTQNVWGSAPAQMSTSSISSGVMTASTLINNVVNFARDYTRIRNVRYRQTHVLNGVTYTDIDQTQVGLLNTNYRQTISGVTLGISRGATIKQPNFTDLMNRWNSLCQNTVTFTVNTYTQYSNHSARSRR